jgi:hypothetical protein
MAYEALASLAIPMAAEIVGNRTGTFVIIGSGDRSALTALPVFESQAELLATRLETVNTMKDLDGLKYPEPGAEPSSALASLATVGSVINAAASLVALFRVDDTFVVKDETPDVRAVYSLVAKWMKRMKVTVYYPDAMAPGLFAAISTSDVHKKLTAVVAALDTLWATNFQRMSDNERATTEAATEQARIENSEKASKDIAALRTERARGTTTADRRRAIDELIEERQADVLDETVLNDARKTVAALRSYLDANKQYLALIDRVLKAGDAYITAITTAEAGATAPLAALIAAERLRAVYLAAQQPYAVEVGVVRLAGTRREHRNFFGTSVSFSGGLVVSYRVFDAKTGELLASDTLSHVNPLKKLEQ